MNSTTTIFDLSLANAELYAGCEIQEVAGRLTLMTPAAEAIHVVGRNAQRIVEKLVADGVEEITLTGAMAIWAYLVVFHSAVHRFRAVYYDDGKPGGKILIAAHP
ncbi:MAG: hypothetical protein M3X11_24840 [Acidobacteriota bacterium]|nr:hypothetical protein [Acidobacteriota bacterium]